MIVYIYFSDGFDHTWICKYSKCHVDLFYSKSYTIFSMTLMLGMLKYSKKGVVFTSILTYIYSME